MDDGANPGALGEPVNVGILRDQRLDRPLNLLQRTQRAPYPPARAAHARCCGQGAMSKSPVLPSPSINITLPGVRCPGAAVDDMTRLGQPLGSLPMDGS